MKGLDNSTYLVLSIISNTVAVLMLLAAWKTPKIARVLFFLLFAWASYANWSYAINDPGAYLDYGDLAFLSIYKQFIPGWFSKHVIPAVGFIATCQALIAISMLLRTWMFKIGCIGAIIFLIAIAPLGVGAAFPCTIILAAALFILLRKSPRNYLWSRPLRKKLYDNLK